MKTYTTRECAAHADTHYPIKNTNHVTAAVTARKHGGINNGRNDNSEGVHTHITWVFLYEEIEIVRQSLPRALGGLNALESVAGRKPKSSI